jgi:hypothetical protein
MKGIKNMDNLKAPKGYELTPRQREGEWYDYYLSRGDYGIIGGISLLESGGVQLDYFDAGNLIEYRGATLQDAISKITGIFDKAAR